jgi:hypothetical protein
MEPLFFHSLPAACSLYRFISLSCILSEVASGLCVIRFGRIALPDVDLSHLCRRAG